MQTLTKSLRFFKLICSLLLLCVNGSKWSGLNLQSTVPVASCRFQPASSYSQAHFYYFPPKCLQCFTTITHWVISRIDQSFLGEIPVQHHNSSELMAKLHQAFFSLSLFLLNQNVPICHLVIHSPLWVFLPLLPSGVLDYLTEDKLRLLCLKQDSILLPLSSFAG